MPAKKPYPITFSVKYQEKLSRLSTLFRLILVIPIIILYQLVVGWHISWHEHHQISSIYLGGGFLFIPLVLMILFRKHYPRWWFDWLQELLRFGARVSIYFFCLTDRYPAVEGAQNVNLKMQYPQDQDLNRFLPLIKWFLALPHIIILLVLLCVLVAVSILGWLCTLIIGRYPRPLFNFMVGYYRWWYRVIAYAFILITDKYPPFSFKA